MSSLLIQAIPCLDDNYAYLIANNATQDAWLVDPSEVDPPMKVLKAGNYRLRGILATHHHHDHVGGIEALVQSCSHENAKPVWVAAHAYDRGRIPCQTIFVDAPADEFIYTGIKLAEHKLKAMHIPGHTLGAIAWYIPSGLQGEGDVFTGDTLFAAGCGRLFEGSPQQMHNSLQRLVQLPLSTRLWFGHEYTASNLHFARVTEPNHPAIIQREKTLGPCTTPTTVALEKATNPFVRAGSPQILAQRRSAKDHFHG